MVQLAHRALGADSINTLGAARPDVCRDSPSACSRSILRVDAQAVVARKARLLWV